MTINHKNVVIIDYQMGNVASVKKAFEKIGAKIKISHFEKDIKNAEYLILPGVGAFEEGMKNLTKQGLINLLQKQVVEKGVPLLGICLGMQLLAETGYEFGTHKGLGWIKGETVKLKAPNLPHVGWNNIKIRKKSIFQNIPDDNFYFVHSYIFKPKNKSITVATCSYGETFTAALQKDNIFATQFHPEKSQLAGLRVLENFLNFKSNYA